MASGQENSHKIIIDLEKVNTLNEDGCPACGGKFSLGEMAVPACGAWAGLKYIHEKDAVFDPKRKAYVDRRCFEK